MRVQTLSNRRTWCAQFAFLPTSPALPDSGDFNTTVHLLWHKIIPTEKSPHKLLTTWTVTCGHTPVNLTVMCFYSQTKSSIIYHTASVQFCFTNIWSVARSVHCAMLTGQWNLSFTKTSLAATNIRLQLQRDQHFLWKCPSRFSSTLFGPPKFQNILKTVLFSPKNITKLNLTSQETSADLHASFYTLCQSVCNLVNRVIAHNRKRVLVLLQLLSMADGERCERPMEKKPVYLFNIWEPKNKQMWKGESRDVSWRGKRGQVHEQRENLRWIYCWVGREAYVERERTEGSVSWIKKKSQQDEQGREAFRFPVLPIRFVVYASVENVNKTWWKKVYLLVPQKPNTAFPSLPVYSTFLPSYEIFIEKCSHFVATQQPPFRAVLSLHFFAFCSQESGDGGADQAESQWSATSLCLSFLSVYGMDIYICCCARLPNASLCLSICQSESTMNTGLRKSSRKWVYLQVHQ